MFTPFPKRCALKCSTGLAVLYSRLRHCVWEINSKRLHLYAYCSLYTKRQLYRQKLVQNEVLKKYCKMSSCQNNGKYRIKTVQFCFELRENFSEPRCISVIAFHPFGDVSTIAYTPKHVMYNICSVFSTRRIFVAFHCPMTTCIIIIIYNYCILVEYILLFKYT
jgi:hypothetical protein